jgi:AmmeMemoRadiSam system protein A
MLYQASLLFLRTNVPAMDLTVEEKRQLLAYARSAIQSRFDEAPVTFPRPSSGTFSQCRGVFVTLRVGTELRGCVGYIESKATLIETVREVAQKAAFEDPRFSPVEPKEIPGISIEISLMSPLKILKDPAAIELGKHGLVIEAEGRRGLLLPQVATEHKWNREAFLNHTALKAGLPSDRWRSQETLICSFTTETFSEAELPPDEHVSSP